MDNGQLRLVLYMNSLYGKIDQWDPWATWDLWCHEDGSLRERT